ncbi:MAG: hypothetical protein ABI415_04195 [Flavitalea sp.]
MEREFYHNEFEELIKEKADQYKMYPSDKVWKGIDRSLRSRRKWYWSGFVILLSGISYVAITEILSPASQLSVAHIQVADKPTPEVTTAQIIPFSSDFAKNTTATETVNPSLSNITIEDSGSLTAAIDIPFQSLGDEGIKDNALSHGTLLIAGLKPLKNNERYNIELTWPENLNFQLPAESYNGPVEGKKIFNQATPTIAEDASRINWLQDHAALNLLTAPRLKHISWQLAFSPTVNYRKLSGNNYKNGIVATNVPLAIQSQGDVNNAVNHKPALGFELGSHAMIPLSKRLTLKGGIQFNYSKYDIQAFKGLTQLATIALNSSTGVDNNSLISYTDISNFGGSSVENLKNQYYQFSLPIGLELKVLGNDRIQLNVAGTIQPTYLLNRNTYLITTDYQNYTTAPSLVRRWNINAGAEAFISYNRGDVKWQIGPQFRYQLLSSYNKAYPIKEYLTEYGIKVGITKTIR